MANELGPNSKYNRLRRSGAFISMVAALGASSVGAAQAHEETSATHNEAQTTLSDTGPDKNSSAGRTLIQFKNTQKVIESLVDSKQPNMYYGAIVINQSSNPDKAMQAYTTLDKNPRDRIRTSVGLNQILVRDPLIVKINGSTFLMTYDRGVDGESNPTGKDADTSINNIPNYRFIDVTEAQKKGITFSYYSHGNTAPSMRHTYAYDGELESTDERTFTPLENILYDFSPKYSPIQTFLKNNDLQPMPKSYEPSFLK